MYVCVCALGLDLLLGFSFPNKLVVIFLDFNLKTTKARWVADEVRDEIAMVPMECHIMVIFNGRGQHLTMISAQVTWNISACYHDT